MSPKFGAWGVWSIGVPSARSSRSVALPAAPKSRRSGPPGAHLPTRTSHTSFTRSERLSTAAASSLLKSERTREEVTWPMTTAKADRMKSVRPAESSARRHLIGTPSSTQHVPRAADGVQQPRLAAGLELAAQAGDEDLARFRRRERVVAPDPLEQALARHDDALVAHQVFEQLELALGEVDVAPAASDLVRVGVQREVADDDRGAAARRS